MTHTSISARTLPRTTSRYDTAVAASTPSPAGHRQRAGAARTASTPRVARPAVQAPTASSTVPSTFIHGGLMSWNHAVASTATATDHGAGRDPADPRSTAPNSNPTPAIRISRPYQV